MIQKKIPCLLAFKNFLSLKSELKGDIVIAKVCLVVLTIDGGKRLHIGENIWSNISESSVRNDLPASKTVIGHIDRLTLDEFTLRLHLMKNAILQEVL